MEIKDALTLMIDFGTFVIVLLTFIITIVIALLNHKK
ncbi:putative holin-like toxin [Paenibacillus popilliae]|nr:putative holin-like toxin [Paenibacillus popilliae]